MLDKLFNPKSVAVIGASNSSGKVGYAIVKNLLEAQFKGKIYPVNIKENIVQGLNAYKSVLDINQNVDVAIIVIPAKFVPIAMSECAKKGIKNVIIITAGFSEVGAEGKKLEDEIRKIVTANKMNVVGPNTLGVINSRNGFNGSFSANFPKEGNIAFVSQSGALATAILDWSKKQKVGFSKFISVGNKSFLNMADYFEYLINDEETSSVFVYMESVKDHMRFVKVASQLSSKKPVILIKSGRSLEGVKAASSHTGALSVDDNLFTVACNKANIVRMNSIEGFFDMAKLLSNINEIKGFNLGVITNAGGPGVITADSSSKHKFPLPAFSKSTIDEILKSNPLAVTNNPMDVIGDAEPADYLAALNALNKDPKIDLIYVLLTPQSMTQPDTVADLIVRHNGKKPVICSFIGGLLVENGKKHLSINGVPEFDTPERGIKALSRLRDYDLKKNVKKDFDQKVKPKKSTNAMIENNKVIKMEDAFKVLSEFEIKTCKTEFVSDEKDFDLIIDKFKFPIAMKAASGIPHKTDLGLVKWNINNSKEAKKIFVNMQTILGKMNKPKQIAVQEMIKGQEVLVSSITNDFGKIITYGLGGIFVEVMKDVSQKIAPINNSDIEEMFNEVKGTAVLKGARTKIKYDVEALKKVIKSVSDLALTYPQLKEIEMNPIIVNETGAYAIDAIMIK